MRPAKRIICSLMLLLAAAATRAADFTPAARRAAISPFLEEVDDEFRRFAEEKRVPGLVWGIVLDAELVHTGNLGWADVERRVAVNAQTRFRIASMTKSFTAAAILRLRDAGRLDRKSVV